MVTVHTSQPVLACLGSQYAGWSLSVDDKGKKYNVLGSGPARAIGSSEKLFDELGYRDEADSAVLVLEADRAPPAGAGRAGRQGLQALARRASPSSMRRPRASPARCRSPRAASKSRCIRRTSCISRSTTSSTASPRRRCRRRRRDFVAAMGRTNDAIIYGGRVQLYVTGGGEGGEGAGRQSAEPQVEGLRQAVRRDLRGGEGRLLRHRPHAVQPGQGDGDGARKRRELRRRGHIDTAVLSRSFA